MAWPSKRDFNNAARNGLFGDPKLKRGTTVLTRRGEPLLYSGGFASVYKVSVNGRFFAVRCFTSEVKDQQRRYQELNNYLRTTDPPGFVECRYLPQGIYVSNGQSAGWYPIVIMDWVNGQTLNEFVEDNLRSPGAISRIADKWRETAVELQRLPIAHNDLQHGNIIVQPDGAIRFVDYDGIFLPAFQGMSSPELGHRNYQHPRRSPDHYDADIDNFPALAIYLGLLAAGSNPDLWKKHNNGDNLLLTRNDFADPQSSPLLRELRSNTDATIARLASELQEYCSRAVGQVPKLESILQPPRSVSRNAAPPLTYREQLMERARRTANKIDLQDFIRFCARLNGREMETLKQGSVFKVRVSSDTSVIYFTPRSSEKERSCPQSETARFLDRFEEKGGSWSTRDYPSSITANASYLLALLRHYRRNAQSYQPAPPSAAENPAGTPEMTQAEAVSLRSELALTQYELQLAQAEAEENRNKHQRAQEELQSVRNRLQAAQKQAEADKAEAAKQLRAAQQQAAAKLQSAHDAAARQLQSARQQAAAELRSARQQADAATAKLRAVQAELRAANDKVAEYAPIDQEHFIWYCRGLNGQRFKTSQGVPFKASAGENALFICASEGKDTQLKFSQIQKFLARFEKTRSQNPQDYRWAMNPRNAAYCIAILESYKKQRSANP